MFQVFLLLLVWVWGSAQDFSIIATENDPSSLVEGVSVITGDLYVMEEDYVVQGAEPVRIRRSFLSRNGVFIDHQHLIAVFDCIFNEFTIYEPNGTAIAYYPEKNDWEPVIGKEFYGKKNKPLVYRALVKNDMGLANTRGGEISAKTNLKNQRIVFDPGRDPKGKSFTLYAADGTERRYVNLEKQEKFEVPFETGYLKYGYKLLSETLPNGHVVQYVWNHDNKVERVYTTNREGSKTFASLQIPYYKGSAPNITLRGSDQREVSYHFSSGEAFVMGEVSFPDRENLKYRWEFLSRRVGDRSFKMPHVRCFEMSKGRFLQVGYSNVEEPWERQARIDRYLVPTRERIKKIEGKPKKKRSKYEFELSQLREREKRIMNDGVENDGVVEGYFVRGLFSPVGKNGEVLKTHSFHFDKPNKTSFVVDALGSKTVYFWNDQFRLVRIEHFGADGVFLGADGFAWEGSLLKAKTLYGEEGRAVYCRTYAYDCFGNVEEEAFYGNLSGEGAPLEVGGDGLPVQNGVERVFRRAKYSQDGRNLLLRQEESSGLVVVYTYRTDCQLPLTKTLCEREQPKIFYEYDYDADLILSRETVRDEVAGSIKIIHPVREGPYVGMPEIVEERDGKEGLLKKTRFHYREGAAIGQKDIYDAKGVHRYSLCYEFDRKGRVKSETNPIGQKAIYDYDEVGNRKYARDFSGKLETFFSYDVSNRLIEKEERGDDGVRRVYQYGYDELHHLISEKDPYQNETIYVPDSRGLNREVRLPAVQNERGERSEAAIRFRYDCMGNEVEKIDAEGFVTRKSLNAYGKPVQITHPDGAVERYTYYLDGSLKTQTDPKGIITRYEYDYLGRIALKEKAGAKETFEYLGRFLKKKTDAEGHETFFSYDDAGRKSKEARCGEEVSYGYDEWGRVRSETKGDLVAITEYNLLDEVIEERNESLDGQVLRRVRYEYDHDKNQKTIFREVDGKAETEEWKFDSLGRLHEKRDALGFVETYRYENGVQETLHTDPLGLKVVERCNSRGQVESVWIGKEQVLSEQKRYYTPRGLLGLQIDTVYASTSPTREVRTCWKYNARGLLETLTEAEGTLETKVSQYTYSPREELKTVTKPNGVVLTYGYDDLGYLKTLDSSDDTVHHRMSYNFLGHLQLCDGVIRETDPFGRIKSEKFPSGLSVENEYDPVGKRKVCKIPVADCLIAYDHDPVQLQSVARKTLNQQPLYRHLYTRHDLSGNLLEEELPYYRGKVIHSWDRMGRRKAIACQWFSQEVKEFDAVGNIRCLRTGTDEAHYEYDDLYQLVSETGQFSHHFGYDSLYNRLQKDGEKYEVNALNQQIGLRYDENGNLKEWGTTKCSYDALDRLIRAETPESTYTYAYDFLHRRLSKRVEGEESKTIHYLYDGECEIGAFDEQLRPIELRVLGDTPHAEIGAAVAIELRGTPFVPIHDLQGNVAVLESLEGQRSSYRYSAFGEERSEGEPYANPWRFSSKRVDPETQFVFFGRRYYVPSLGRWLTPDPSGFEDGMNLYAFVQNCPLTHLDEFGLIMTARDYETVQQIVKESRDSPRSDDWDKLSLYGRHLLSKTTHDLYDEFVAPLHFDIPAGCQGFNEQPISREQRIYQEKQSIDRFFGTNYANRVPSYFENQVLRVGIPFGPPTQAMGTGRIAGAVRSIFRNKGVLEPARKLSANQFLRVDTTKIRFPLSRSLSETASSSLKLNRFHQAAYNLSETGQNNIRILRGWARSKGWERLPNFQGGPEKWGTYQNGNFEWRLVIKPEPSSRSGLHPGSNIPRFDARFLPDPEGQSYINPFVGKPGNWQIGTHLPLEFNY